MPHSRNTSTGSGRSAGSAKSRISKTSNVSRGTNTSIGSSSGHVTAGTSGGVISRMLSTFQKKNQQHRDPNNTTVADKNIITKNNNDKNNKSSDLKARFPRLGPIDEDKENWIVSYQVTHHPDRPERDKRTRPDLLKEEHQYWEDVDRMQKRNAERRNQAAAVAAGYGTEAGDITANAHVNIPPAIHSAGFDGASRRRGLGLQTNIDTGMPNFSYSSSSPKGSRENLSSVWPVFNRTEWQHVGPGGETDIRPAPSRRARSGTGSDDTAWSDSPVSPSAMTIQVGFHPESIYHGMPVSAPNLGEDDNSARSVSLFEPFTAPIEATLGRNENEYGKDDEGAATRPASYSRNENKTRRERHRRNSTAATRGGVPQSQTHAMRVHHKRLTRDSRASLYAADVYRRHSASSLAPSLVPNSSSSTSSPERAVTASSPLTPVSNDEGAMELLRRNSSNYGSTQSLFLLNSATYTRPQATWPTCPMPGCYAPLMRIDDRKHNLCAGCRRELQPRESTFFNSSSAGSEYGSFQTDDDDDSGELEILIQRHPETVEHQAPAPSNNDDGDSIRRTDVTQAAHHHPNLSSHFNHSSGGEFRLQPAPLGRGRSKRLAQQKAASASGSLSAEPLSRSESASAPPPPTYHPPPPPPPQRSSSLLTPSTTGGRSSHIGHHVALGSKSPALPPDPGTLLLLEPKTFQPNGPSQRRRRRRGESGQKNQDPTPHQHHPPDARISRGLSSMRISAVHPAPDPPRRPKPPSHSPKRSPSPNPHPNPNPSPNPGPPPRHTSASSSEDLYRDIASIIDSYAGADHARARSGAWESERRKAADVVAACLEDPEDVEMRRLGFF
ncbi:hypothetical protein F4810DRAFT_139216 [Camillea tinctor]|nr:hypothetical protein F4810DRAFT_139216 [Camillea tinctor]